jgi:predicted phage-related endonuclease
MHYRIPKRDRANWLVDRWINERGEKRIAASSSAAVHNEHQYVSAADLAVELLADAPPQPKETNSAMDRGIRLEPPIRQWASDIIGKKLHEPSELYCYEEPGVRLIATIDSMTEDGKVYEQKTMNKIWRGQLSGHWYWQGVQQAICCDVDEITWVIFDSTLELTFYTQRVTSDEKRMHIEKCRQFLAFIDMGIVPDNVVMEYEHVAKRYPEGKGGVDNTKELGPQALDALERYLLAKEQVRVCEVAESLAKAELCDMMGDSEFGTVQDELVCTWRNSSRTTFDTKKFEAEHPALAAKYKKQSNYRTFRVTNKEK